MYSGNISKDFAIGNMKKKTVLKEIANFFSVDFSSIDTSDILNIHKYLMDRAYYKIMFGLIKKIFIGLVIGLVNGINHPKSVKQSEMYDSTYSY